MTSAVDLQPLLYSTGQAAARLGKGRNKLRALISSGQIKAVMIDGRIHVTAEALAAYIAGLPEYTKGKPVRS